MASTAALGDADWILPQYREMGADVLARADLRADRQPAHRQPARPRQRAAARPAHRRQVEALPVRQVAVGHPPAAGGGAAYRSLAARKEARVAIAYFGEGTSSEGDTPSALNIAAVHGCPTIFFCRNNGYAISTNARDQYKGDGVAPRGVAFGMPAIRVDGNDIFAVYAATAARAHRAAEGNKPTMIEGMTYRIGAHSTSDDDTKYRKPDRPEPGTPTSARTGRRARRSSASAATSPPRGSGRPTRRTRKPRRARAIKALNDAERVGKLEPYTLFTDVWDEMLPALAAQRARDPT